MQNKSRFKIESLNYNKPATQYVLAKVQHECITGLNCSRDRNIHNLRDYPLCRISHPSPVYTSPIQPNKQDICHNRTKANYDYVTELRRWRTLFKNQKAKPAYRKSMKKNRYPISAVRFMELLEQNPDPYFSGSYDWYFTGGNLDVSEDGGLIAHAAGANVDILMLSRLSLIKDKLTITTENTKQLEETKDPEIFEMQFLNNLNKSSFCLRQKHSISIYKQSENNLQCDFKFESDEVPFISFAHDATNTDHFLTSDLSKTVTLWDLQHPKKYKQIIYKGEYPNNDTDQNWNCLKYYDNNSFGFAGLNDFCLLDSRISADKSKVMKCSFDKIYDRCERVSSLWISDCKNLAYIGTTHKFLAVDTRYVQKELEDTSHLALKWVHQMDLSPLILRNYKRSNEEIVAMSSPISSDVRICETIEENDGENTKYASYCLPYMPPCLNDSYMEARLHGICLDPVVNLQERIKCCTTGLSFCSNNQNLFLLISNSIGDIFAQQITYEEQQFLSCFNGIYSMQQWESDIKEQKLKTNPPLNVTNIEDLAEMSKVFRCKLLGNKRKHIFDEPKRPLPKQSWQRPVHDLLKYKDALATDLLSIWDIDEDQAKPEINFAPESDKKLADEIKVDEWLQSTGFEENVPMLSIGNTSLIFSNTQDVDDTAMLDTQKKKLKRKRTYVKGF